MIIIIIILKLTIKIIIAQEIIILIKKINKTNQYQKIKILQILNNK
jgi:hypothetical protein